MARWRYSQRAISRGYCVVAQLVGRVNQRGHDWIRSHGGRRVGTGVSCGDVVTILYSGDRAAQGVGVAIQTSGIGGRDRQRRWRNRQGAVIRRDSVVAELVRRINQRRHDWIRSYGCRGIYAGVSGGDVVTVLDSSECSGEDRVRVAINASGVRG